MDINSKEAPSIMPSAEEAPLNTTLGQEALCSILCEGDGKWSVDLEHVWIVFHKDYTGLVKLSAGGGFHISVFAHFEWKCMGATIKQFEPVDPHQTQKQQEPQSSRLLGRLHLEIILRNRPPPGILLKGPPLGQPLLNGGCLTDDAFDTPRSFTVRIEQGRFPLPAMKYDDTLTGTYRPLDYERRLQFDRSPYPPESKWRESWKEEFTVPNGPNYWDEKEFANHDAAAWERISRELGTSFGFPRVP